MDQEKLARITASLMSSYLSNQSIAISPDAIPALVSAVMTALNGKAEPIAKPAPKADALKTEPQIKEATANKRSPAVPVSESITPEYLICLEDGRKLKFLKPHLKAIGLTPDGYRKRWNLPSDYPMTAPKTREWFQAHSAKMKKIKDGKKSVSSPLHFDLIEAIQRQKSLVAANGSHAEIEKAGRLIAALRAQLEAA